MLTTVLLNWSLAARVEPEEVVALLWGMGTGAAVDLRPCVVG